MMYWSLVTLARHKKHKKTLEVEEAFKASSDNEKQKKEMSEPKEKEGEAPREKVEDLTREYTELIEARARGEHGQRQTAY